MQTPIFNFDNSFARDMEGFYIPWSGAQVPQPRMLRLNRPLAEELNLDPEALDNDLGAAILAGAESPASATPLAMAYAGHQFGGFSPQLGDGRALLIGELIDRNGKRRDIHLKGSGPTPFARGGDGKAVLGPVLREYLIGEAMHALAIPTTRALAAVLTGERIERDGQKPGAVLARVASSHLRIGTFQYFAAHGSMQDVGRLADYAIARHYPEIAGRDDRYLELLRRVRDAQAALVARWMLVGFVHGVMNTDNMSISGETIDYGPCAFIDSYDPAAVFSSIDRMGRYAYGNQPSIAQWNLARFAETLLELIDPENTERAIQQATDELNLFPDAYQTEWLRGMRLKLGLVKEQPGDLDLTSELFRAIAGQRVDFTLLFRSLSDALRGETGKSRAPFADPARFDAWLERYLHRGAEEDIALAARADAMDQVNPIYIPRNHKVEEALAAALEDDMAPFERLLQAVSTPFDERDDFAELALPAPAAFGRYTTYCGT